MHLVHFSWTILCFFFPSRPLISRETRSFSSSRCRPADFPASSPSASLHVRMSRLLQHLARFECLRALPRGSGANDAQRGHSALLPFYASSIIPAKVMYPPHVASSRPRKITFVTCVYVGEGARRSLHVRRPELLYAPLIDGPLMSTDLPHVFRSVNVTRAWSIALIQCSMMLTISFFVL